LPFVGVAGEDVKKEGGLFGIGAKEAVVPTGAAMTALLNEVRDKAVAAYNVRERTNHKPRVLCLSPPPAPAPL
jgi:hypothetical protein